MRDLKKSSMKWFNSLNKPTKFFLTTEAFLALFVLLFVPFIVLNRATFQPKAESPENSPTFSKKDTMGKHVPGQLLIRFKGGASLAAQNSVLKGNNSEIIDEIPEIGVKVIKVPDVALEKVRTAL